MATFDVSVEEPRNQSIGETILTGVFFLGLSAFSAYCVNGFLGAEEAIDFLENGVIDNPELNREFDTQPLAARMHSSAT